MNEIQKLAVQIKTNPDDLGAWQRLSQLVDDPAKKRDCQNQLTRIKNKNRGFDEIIQCNACDAWMEIYLPRNSKDKIVVCPFCQDKFENGSLAGQAIEADTKKDNISDGRKTASNRLSITAIVISNLVTIIGVLFWQWDVWTILLLYWLESVVVGFYATLRMILAEVEQPLFHLYKLFIIPFFCVSYGIFCMTAGGFLFMLFMGMGGGIERFAPHVAGPLTITQVLTITAANLWQGRSPGMEWFVFGLFISHGISFLQNHFKREEHTPDTWVNLMAQPYISIIPLEIAIMISAMPIFVFGSFMPLLIVLVMLKTGINVWQYTNPIRMPRIKLSTKWKF